MRKTIQPKDIKIKLRNPFVLSEILIEGKLLPVSRISIVGDVNDNGYLKIEMDIFAEEVEIETKEGQEVKLNIFDLSKEKHGFSLN